VGGRGSPAAIALAHTAAPRFRGEPAAIADRGGSVPRARSAEAIDSARRCSTAAAANPSKNSGGRGYIKSLAVPGPTLRLRAGIGGFQAAAGCRTEERLFHGRLNSRNLQRRRVLTLAAAWRRDCRLSGGAALAPTRNKSC